MQRLIAHRGNFKGVNKQLENTENYIKEAIDNGYDVEIDIWLTDKGFWLGHDEPSYKTSIKFLSEFNKQLWVHCKNLEALAFLKDGFNCFFHNTDDAVLTSKNYIWTYPGKRLMSNSIAVKPEGLYSEEELKVCYGICSDFL